MSTVITTHTVRLRAMGDCTSARKVQTPMQITNRQALEIDGSPIFCHDFQIKATDYTKQFPHAANKIVPVTPGDQSQIDVVRNKVRFPIVQSFQRL